MARRRTKRAEASLGEVDESAGNSKDAAHATLGLQDVSEHISVSYTIGDTPRSSASIADGEMGPLVVSAGRSSASTESRKDTLPEPSKKLHSPGGIAEQPSFIVSVRRTATTLSPISARREPHYMQPLVRDSRSPTGGLLSHRDDDSQMHEAAERNHPTLAAYHALHRIVPYVPPTPGDIVNRESAKRERITTYESEEFQDIHETCMHDVASIKATIARREKYLASFEYAKCQAVGHDRRARIQQWEADKQKAALEALTFAPHISQHASQIRSSHTMDGFLAANKLWVEQNQKKRRAASAVVFRQEDATFAPQISANSFKIVERLRKESKHTNIVDGWAQRLDEHKQKMEALQAKYAHPFQPQSLQRAHSRGGAVSVSPKRVSAQAVVTRLYDASLEHLKAVEATLEGQRQTTSLSPKPVRRSTTSIQEHIRVMQSRDEKLQKKLATKRAHSIQEETQLEHNSYMPIVNPNSVTLAELHRMRRSTSLTHASPPAAGASSIAAPQADAINSSSVHHMLFRSATAASESKQRSRSTSLPQQEQHQASERSGRHSSRSTREFLMRNEKLLQTRDVHIREIREQMQEQQVRDCTFAPSISTTTVRLAEHRRASQYRDPESFGGDVVELSPQVLRAFRHDAHNAMPHRSTAPLGTGTGGSALGSKSPSHRTPVDGAISAASSHPAVRFQRTDNEGPPPHRSSTSSLHGSETLQERMEDIEGLLRQWRWLEESSRL